MPHRVSLRPSRRAILAVLVLGMILFAVTLPGVVRPKLSEIDEGFVSALTSAAYFPAIGLALAALALYALLRRRSAIFGTDGVQVIGDSPFTRESWQEPYSAFRGVLHREQIVRRKTSSTTYQIIELLHEEPEKTLPLLVEVSNSIPRAAWERYAKWLDLPALADTPDGLITRDQGDLDKSLRELAAEGKLAPGPNTAAGPAPAGLEVVGEDLNGEDHLRIRLTVARSPLWILLLFSSLPLVLLVVGVTLSPLAAVFALLFLAAQLAVYLLDRFTPREILITGSRLTVKDAWRRKPREDLSFALNEIESITIRRSGSGGGKDILIAGDRTHMVIGRGLSQGALIWLEDCLTSAVVKA